MEHEIKSSQFPYNMAAWCNEKAEHSLASIAHTVDQVRPNGELGKKAKESILSELSYAVWDASKLLAFSCGAIWEVSDSDIIFTEGYAGLEKVMVRYGLLQETTEDKKQKHNAQFLSRLQILLEGQRDPNRTLLHEHLAGTDIKHAILDDIANLLEKVTMGEMEWVFFVEKAKELAKRLREAIV